MFLLYFTSRTCVTCPTGMDDFSELCTRLFPLQCPTWSQSVTSRRIFVLFIWYTRTDIAWCPPILRSYLYDSLAIYANNSLWPSDAIWRQRSGSTLAQVTACCLTAPSHYLNQRWLLIGEVLLHFYLIAISQRIPKLLYCIEFENCIFNITTTSANGQWIKILASVPGYQIIEHMKRLSGKLCLACV